LVVVKYTDIPGGETLIRFAGRFYRGYRQRADSPSAIHPLTVLLLTRTPNAIP